MTGRETSILTHYSKKPIEKLRSIRQDKADNFKPKGLWYSVDGDWERWCKAEEYGDLDRAIRHELILGEEKLLRLRTVKDILAFHTKYREPEKLRGYLYPEWSRVAKDYDGIEIAPYQWALRLDSRVHWYYSWDCASGCLWRPRGATIKLSGGLP